MIGGCQWYTDVSILLQLLPILILHPEYRLLEDPLREVVVVLDNTLREPPALLLSEEPSLVGDGEYLQSNLLLGALNGVRTVADVAADSQSKVTTDGT